MDNREEPDPGETPMTDEEFAAYFAWVDAEVAAGRDPFPNPPEEQNLGISISLGDATSLDPMLLAAMCGPDGLGGECLGPQFRQHAPVDTLSPGPVLAALTEQAVTGLSGLNDDELIGALRASVRLASREGWKQELLVAEYARRREVAKDAETAACGGRLHCRSGEFPGEELAAELLIGPFQAASRIETARELTGRLPATLAYMEAGLIDSYRGSIIAGNTCLLSDAHAALADKILAEFALGRTAAALARKAAALAMKLDPEAVKAWKERARRDFQRVEARREASGNASLSGREMDTSDVIASKAHIDALAAKLRAAGVPGTLDALRTRAFAELTQGRDPLGLISQASSATPPADAAPERPGPAESAGDGIGEWPRSDPSAPGCDEDPDDDSLGTAPRRDPAPLPALINLLIPAGTWLGWSTTPGHAAGWGLLDRQEMTDLLRAAAQHPRTRWCATLVGSDGTAVAHACAKGRHRWLADIPSPPGVADGNQINGPDPPQWAQLAEIIRRLGLTFTPIAKGTCAHDATEDRYTPSRNLRHLVRARTDRCDAPGCQAPAVNGDLDHTIEYPAGTTCECNLGPKCRRHHRCKQAPGWKLEQPEPGVMRWTLPSGRVHVTRPTVYDL